MQNTIKIAIIGDFNFTYNAHHATNLALEHTQLFLEVDINHYWIRTQEAASYNKNQFEEFDGIWIAPGPFSNLFYLQGILRTILTLKVPIFITGEAYKEFMEAVAKLSDASIGSEKIVSDNMVKGDVFETVEITPITDEMKKFYFHHSKIELSSCRFSTYPRLMPLLENTIEILALNPFDDPEVISLKPHPFCVVCMFCPQISSTREMPHPLINYFIKACSVNLAE